MRKCPSLCSGPGHDWTHCSLFLELLVTLGQLDGTGQLPWARPPLNAHGKQPVWKDGSWSLRGLGEVLSMAVRRWGGAGLGASFVFSEAEVPQLWPFGMLVVILETAPLPRIRSFLGRKVKRASRSWS